MSALEIIVATIIFVFAMKGMKQGLVLTICSFVTLFLAIIITQAVTPQVSSMIRENDKIVSFMSEQVESVLFNNKDDKSDSKLNNQKRIEKLSIPKVLKKDLTENDNKSKYEELGAANFQEYASTYVAYSIINSITYVVVFIIILSLLKIITHALNLLTKLPVIHTLNKLGGLGVGVLEGFIIVWIGFVALTMFCSTDFGTEVLKQIEKSVWLSYLYDNNLILNAVLHVTKAVF